MEFVEDITKGLSDKELKDFILNILERISYAKKPLIIHPDYTREDFTDRIASLVLEKLIEKGAEKIDFLNAGGTHRAMSEAEFCKKLGISKRTSNINFYNHEFDNPQKLTTVGNISYSFQDEKSSNGSTYWIPVTVNKLIFADHDLIIAISGTSPHEASGYSGGTKIFFPGLSGPDVINLFHWVASLIGIKDIIGTVDNAARKIIDTGASYIFKKIKAKVLSFNMVSISEKNRIVPIGLYVDSGLEGFTKAQRKASIVSSKAHIKYLDSPLKKVVQVIPSFYDELWTAGKASYKLQREGVIEEGGEIIIFAPHIKKFHSNAKMEAEILKLGYHCRDYILNLFKNGAIEDTNVAAHLINVTGPGTFDLSSGMERLKFRVTLATSIPEEICKSVCLGYLDPKSIKKENFIGPGKLWIEEGGKYLYDLKK